MALSAPQAKPAAPRRAPQPARAKPALASPSPGVARLARKCSSCGGGALPPGLGLQTKLQLSDPAGVDEHEADRVADQVVARLAGEGGGEPSIHERPAAAAQRSCSACAAEEAVQRKPAGGTPAEIQLGGGGGERLAPAQRQRMEAAFGRGFGDVRVHADAGADRSARRLAARAYTVGNHVYFAGGEYQPGTRAGDQLLAHELTHVVQQRQAGPAVPQAKCAACASNQAEEAVQRDVFDGMPSLPTWDEIEAAGGELIDEAVEVGSDAVGVVADTAEGVIDAGVDAVNAVARQALALANRFADALGGASVELVGTAVVITAPGPIPLCPELDLALELPGLEASFPIAFGLMEIAGPLLAYGELSANAALTPSLLGQLGPCAATGIRLVIDPLGGSFAGSGAVSATVALGLHGALELTLGGEVGLMIVWPDPPFVLTIPVVGLQAGLVGAAQGLIATEVSVAGAMSYGGGAFALAASQRQTLGVAADAGVAGFGQLSLLGQNLCRIHWPLVDWQEDMAVDSGFDLAVAIGPGGAAASFTTLPATLNPLGFDALAVRIPRTLFADDCPLCGILQRAGLMPSQLGGAWTARSPGLPHGGPLLVYPNAPPIASGSKCRGACGSNCETCDPPEDPTAHLHKVCEESTGPDGQLAHHFWIYPNFHHCNTHEGCRQHDACYDWAAGFGERGPLGILGPIHRLCDLEAICGYGLPQAVGWISGKPPYDGGMDFSDKPKLTGDCPGACPDERETEETTRQRICLPELTIFERRNLLSEEFAENSGWIELFEFPIEFPPVLLGLHARAGLSGSVSADLGPLLLRQVCLDIDPVSGDHHGTAQLSLMTSISGVLKLIGEIEARAGWGCWFGVIDATFLSGILALIGEAKAKLNTELRDTVEVGCRDGRIVLDNTLELEPCLELLFSLDAALRLELFHRFEIFRRQWHLTDWAWSHCWPFTLSATSTDLGEWDFNLAGQALDMGTLLRDLLSDGNSTTPGHNPSPPVPPNPAQAAGRPDPCGSSTDPDNDCGSPNMPRSILSFQPGPRGQGLVARAAPLSRCEGNTQGSQPDPAIYGAQFACMRGIETPPGSGKTESRFWVRAHLVHGETGGTGGRDLHGPGDQMANLIISDKSFNGRMRTGPERFALDRVYDPANPQVLWYETRVTPFAPPMDFYGANVSVTVGQWDLNANAPGPQLNSFGPFPTRRPPPTACP